MFKYYAFRFLGFICPLLPAQLGYWLFARAGDLAFLFAPKTITYYKNVRRILGDTATDAEINSVAHRAFQNLLKNYFDLFRWHGMSKDKVRAQLAGLHGFEHMENAIKQGKGIIGGSGHFGAWDLILHLTATHLDVRVVVPNEHIQPEALFQYVLSLRRAQGIDMVPLEVAPRALIKALREKQLAGLAYDRDVTKTGPIVNFLGAPAQMPDGGVQLALKYGAPLILGFSVRQPDNRSVVYVEPALEFEKTGDMARDIQVGVQKIANVLEKYIRQYPDQWLMFQKIWED